MPEPETPHLALPPGMEIRGALPPRAAEVLTPEALAFVADLVRRFRPRVEQLLERRREMQRRYDAGERPNFLSSTEEHPRRRTGPSRRSRRTSRIAASRSPARWTAR